MQCWGESVLIAMYARCLTTIDVQYGDRLRGSFKDMAGVSECTYAVHGRCRMSIDPRPLIMSGRSTLGFRVVLGESHEGGAAC